MYKLDKVDKILITIIAILVGMIWCEVIALVIFFRDIDMPEPEITVEEYYLAEEILWAEYDMDISLYCQNKKYYKEKVEDLANLGPYFYFEKEMDNASGAAIMLARTIIVDPNIVDREDYCWVFTHEVLHFTKFSGNDTYISFETFKFLYESEDEYLHNAGVKYGLKQLHEYFEGEYDCSKYIIDYLVKEKSC